MRRDVGRHADRDADRTIDEHVREARWQHGWFLRGLVEVGLKRNRLFFDVLEHRLRKARHAGFGVPVSRGRIAVDTAEIALPVDHHVAQVPPLRQAHHRLVNRRVAVRVVLLDDLTDHARALDVAAVAGHVEVRVHRVQNAALHGLQAVAHVGQGAFHNRGHRVGQERRFDFIGDVDGDNRGQGNLRG